MTGDAEARDAEDAAPEDLREDLREDLLTVAEAAAQLGISERRLRHILKRGEYAASMRQMTRRTSSGIRHSAGIPPESFRRLIEEIAEITVASGPTRHVVTEVADDVPDDESGASPGIGSLGDNEAQRGGTYAAENGEHPAGRGDKAAAAGSPPETFRRQIRAELQEEMEAEHLRRDNARLEDENRFMREQLAQAVAGWRDEQRRVKELEQKLKELPAPAATGQASTPEAPKTEPGDTPGHAADVSGILTPAGAAPGDAEGRGETPGDRTPEKPAGWGARLKGWFFNA